MNTALKESDVSPAEIFRWVNEMNLAKYGVKIRKLLQCRLTALNALCLPLYIC